MCLLSGCGAASNEEVYLRAYESVTEARSDWEYLEFYNSERKHQNLGVPRTRRIL